MANLRKNKFITYSNEMIFALVQPTGTDLSNVRGRIEEATSKFDAKVEYVNLTDFLKTLDAGAITLTQTNSELKAILDQEVQRPDGFKNLSTKMHHGTKLREHFGSAIFSIYGMARINISRDALMTSLLKKEERHPPSKRVYVLDSLKHPEEVDLLREIYGKSFWLIGVSAEKNKRIKHLQTFRGLTQEEASELVSRDEDEKNVDFGQKMTEAFEKADFFFNESCAQSEVDRFFNIAFGNIKVAPRRDEQFMHVAASIAAQSSDLSRQVGAVIVSKSGELLGIGCNDVPKFPGGQYKEGDSTDYRDVTIGHDPNHRRRDQILENIPGTTDQSTKDMIKNLIEYHRAVHAEMEALISCARRGLSTVDSVMFTTTYPCHNCAKHLLNAGVQKVIYIQAYAKSLAIDLHDDAITEDVSEASSKMTLQRYIGIGPRKYIDHFSLTLGESGFKRKGVGVDKKWKTSIFNANLATPKYPLVLVAAIQAEKEAMKHLLGLNIIDTSSSIFAEVSRLKAS